MSTTSLVKSCATTACAFNNGGCTAFAITVGGSEAATCTTFVELDARAGVSSASGQVGACKRLECVHNKDLLCTAGEIAVGDAADCLSYSVG
ncbi:MAG: DUF1540 domain-containing protein [Micropruina sp.]|uniref:DUF1540 domain-containing protein n=1 Tax=Micropruina sp. TaxID=2737536 RepID=UPI0039E43CB6